MVLSYLKVHWAISIDWENTQRSPIQGISCVSLQKSTKAKSTQKFHYNWNEKPTLRSAIVKLSSKPRPSRSRWASCVWRKKLIFEFPIYVFHLKSSKVLDHKIVDCDVEIDGDRVGNSKKCSKSKNSGQASLLDWVNVEVRHFKGVKRWDAQVGDTWEGKTSPWWPNKRPPVGIWVLSSSRMAAMYSSTAGSLRAIPCPRVDRESKANTILRCLQLTWHVHAWHVLSWHEAIWSMSHKIKLIPHFHPMPRKCVRSQSMKDRKRKDNIFSSAQLLYLCIWILSVIVAQ